MPTSALNGKLLWFNPQKGYGIIRPNDLTADDVYCPASALQGDQYQYGENVEVLYHAEQQLSGMVATSVWKVVKDNES
jgi:Cold shock proteins